MFQQDGATCHTSKSVSEWFTEHKWKVSYWPANSTDLNLIENVWGLKKKAVEKKKPKNLDDLEAAVQEVWNGLSMDYLKSLIDSMIHRVQKCIEVQGHVTGY